MRRAGVHADAGEVAITERLRDGMRQALSSTGLPWGDAMVVLPGTESRSIAATSIPDGRTDIPILMIAVFRRFGEHDPHAIIECKRIAADSAGLCREYVVEGIDRFRTGKYAGNHSAGFMAGYLIAGSANDTAAKVNRYLARKSRCVERLRPSGLVSESWAWESRHPRTARPPVEIHHALLPGKAPPRRRKDRAGRDPSTHGCGSG